jgi:hypothetical protein
LPSKAANLIYQATAIHFGMLIVLALCKLLTTGWKGGYIFPIMFAGVALGLAGKLLFPSVPTAVTAAATLAGALVTTLRTP